MLHELRLSERGGVAGSECCQFAGIGGKNDCELILDQNLEERGSMVIFRALQERDTVNSLELGSTVNIEVMFVLCKSCNHYKLLEN